jgi:hypothetical protein
MGLLLLMGGVSDPNPQSLFANNEAGLALDVETAYRRGWIFQDSAGATVSAAAGDPVGLILDTAKGGLNSLGSDLVSNGTFATDTVWSKGANWTIGSGVATKTGGAANNLTQTITSTAGLWYRITMDVTRTAGELTVSLGTSGTTRAINASGSYTFFILAGSSTQTLTLAGDSAFAGTVDNVTARLVPGNHPYQTTSGSRPALCRTPDGGRRNLLVRTEEMVEGVAWTNAGTTSTVTQNAIANPLDGQVTADNVNITDVSSSRFQQTALTISASTQYTISAYFKNNTMTTGQTFDFRISNFLAGPNDLIAAARVNLFDGSVTNVSGGSGVSGTSVAIVALANGWYRVSVTFTSGAGAATTLGGIQLIRSSNAANFYAFGFQYELGSSATTYQRVGLTSDVTESGKRDCWGLLADGSDDSLITSSVNFSSTDKMTVMAGLRKLSDAASACFVELGTDAGSVNGTFAIYAPRVANAGVDYRGRGTTSVTITENLSSPSPTTLVFTGQTDIAGDSSVVRKNGSQANSSSSDLGSGNFANLALNLMRRSGGTLPFTGILYTLIIRGAATPTGTIADFEKNLLRIRAGLGPF